MWKFSKVINTIISILEDTMSSRIVCDGIDVSVNNGTVFVNGEKVWPKQNEVKRDSTASKIESDKIINGDLCGNITAIGNNITVTINGDMIGNIAGAKTVTVKGDFVGTNV